MFTRSELVVRFGRARRALKALFCLAALLLVSAVPAEAAKKRHAPKRTPVTVAPDPQSGPVGAPGGHISHKVVRGKGLRKRRKTRIAGTAAADPGALILYDTTGPYGWLGQTYGTMVANLVSHFGPWTAKPVDRYTAGDVNRYTATIYVGSTYDEPLPAAFLADVPASQKPVVWIYDNIWRLTASYPEFQGRYGWMWWQFTSCSTCGLTSPVASIEYKGQSISRSRLNDGGVMDYSAIDPAKVETVASAVRDDGTRFPWAVRSENLTYIGENPFSYFSEGDRMMVFADILFDALAPRTQERHRALLRLEDITPASDPDELRVIADYLASKKVPFGFGVSPLYKDPKGHYNNGKAVNEKLSSDKEMMAALKYLEAKGGTIVAHGYTHQYAKVANPYNAVSGDDFEFYRTIENADHTLSFVGPVPEDSAKWAGGRMDDALKEIKDSKLTTPKIWEFPHYAGSVVDYQESAKRFGTRWERSLYPLGALTNTKPDYTRVSGQLFPYVVRDIYGQKVLPENLGNVEPEPFHQFPVRMPGDIIRDAQRNLVVRDGFAAMYFHPFWDLDYLKETVNGIQALGYEFVSPETL